MKERILTHCVRITRNMSYAIFASAMFHLFTLIYSTVFNTQSKCNVREILSSSKLMGR